MNEDRGNADLSAPEGAMAPLTGLHEEALPVVLNEFRRGLLAYWAYFIAYVVLFSLATLLSFLL